MHLAAGWWQLAAVAWVVGVSTAVGFCVVPGGTNRRRIRARSIIAVARTVRAAVVRGACAVAAWPHLLDVVRRVGRHAPPSSPSEVQALRGPARLHRFHSEVRRAGPVLVVHSVISSATVLDLTPQASLVGSLRDAGHDVWLLDWDFGAAGPALALEHLAGAVAWASTEVRSVTGAPPAAVVGYCLGATIALLREAAWPSGEPLVLIAPVVAASPDSGMGRLLGHPRFHPLLALDADGRVPASLVRESFHWLRPRALRTVRTWTAARRDPRLAQGYAAMARWVWDHQDLPGGILLDVVDLYRQGGLAQGWNVNGAPVSLAAVDGPVLVVCASRDHIVPPSSSTALLDLAGDRVEVLEVDSGHVGMLVNLGSGELLRPALLAWLAQARPPALRPSARRRSPAG